MSTNRNIVGFQQNNRFIGKQYENHVVDHLISEGWSILQRNAQRCFVEIDIVATDSDGREVWMECKTGIEDSFSKNPGLARIDTVQKVVGKAFGIFTKEEKKPYWIVTSHLPKLGSHGHSLLQNALDNGLIEKILHLKFEKGFEVIEHQAQQHLAL